ncbi:hypothetical protein E2C01_043090 [Portunus trituberculatus]|uniref:Uncharacterized protein n=1 Tax=Portunus trituberculatus TaxID=210409 RepID=A0A5B7FRZ6_PORTR|nr:hypothetical protein [Portunus trituberculatus]
MSEVFGRTLLQCKPRLREKQTSGKLQGATRSSRAWPVHQATLPCRMTLGKVIVSPQPQGLRGSLGFPALRGNLVRIDFQDVYRVPTQLELSFQGW